MALNEEKRLASKIHEIGLDVHNSRFSVHNSRCVIFLSVDVLTFCLRQSAIVDSRGADIKHCAPFNKSYGKSHSSISTRTMAAAMCVLKNSWRRLVNSADADGARLPMAGWPDAEGDAIAGAVVGSATVMRLSFVSRHRRCIANPPEQAPADHLARRESCYGSAYAMGFWLDLVMVKRGFNRREREKRKVIRKRNGQW